MSYVVRRDSKGNRTITYTQKGVNTSITMSGDEFKNKYGSGRRASRTAAYTEATDYNARITSGDQSPKLVDASGKTLSPYEASGAAPSSTETGTQYSTVTVTRPQTSADATVEEWKTLSTKPTPTTERPAAVMGKNNDYTGFGQTNYKGKNQFMETVKDRTTRPIIAKGKEIYDYYRPVVPAAVFAAAPVGKVFSYTKSVFSAAAAPIAVPVAKAASAIKYAGLRNAALTTFNVVGTGTIVKGTQTIGRSLSGSTVTASGQGREAYAAGLSASNEQRTGFTGRVDRYVSGIPAFGRAVPLNKQAFEAGVTDYAIKKGIDPQVAIKSAYQSRNIGDASMFAGLSFANFVPEIGGQVAISKVPAAQRGKFWTGFKNIFPQGISEGAAVAVAEETATGKKVKDFNPLKIAGYAGMGGLTAGTLGGVIYSAKPAVSKGLLTSAYALDPFEAIGDAAAAGAVPVVTPSLTFASSSRSNTAPTRGAPVVSASSPLTSPVTGTTPTSVQTYTPTATPATTNTPLRTNPFTSIKNTFFSSTPTPTNTFINVNTPVNTNVNTPVSSFTRTNTYTPTFSGGGASFPILPLGGGGGGGKSSIFDKIKQPRFYTPSLGAAVLGIKGARPSSGAIKTGLVVRPII